MITGWYTISYCINSQCVLAFQLSGCYSSYVPAPWCHVSTDSSWAVLFTGRGGIFRSMRVTKLDRIRNERIRGTTKVGEISKKVQESRLRWYGHGLRRGDEYVGKRVMGMEMPGQRRRGRPKRRWLDSIRNDLSERELSVEDAQDRPRWRRLTRHIDPT